MVEDRNRITGGGVTAGIDFGLTVAARLLDQTRAEQIQLTLEYKPSTPFQRRQPGDRERGGYGHRAQRARSWGGGGPRCRDPRGEEVWLRPERAQATRRRPVQAAQARADSA